MKKFPLYGWIGLALVLVFWYLNWFLIGLRTQWCFFPMWLGYILTVDGVVLKRSGTSLIKRSMYKFIMLFVISAPVWWLFEFFNIFTQNWAYMGSEYFSDLQYFLFCSLNFSIVMPAVFESAELASGFKWIKKYKLKTTFTVTNSTIKKIFLAGVITISLLILLPEYFYYLLWVALYFIIDAVNYKLKNRSLIKYASEGNWKPFLSLAIGCLITGFFWEMWNYFSYPKWVYNLPFVNYMHLFEMPVFGYSGYIPFSFELFAIYNLFLKVKLNANEEYYLFQKSED